MNVVEVPRAGGDVAEPMRRMRSWLDTHRIAPLLFRLDREVFYLEFGTKAEAMAFADAFDGHVIDTEATAA
jgi:hypothetical protein